MTCKHSPCQQCANEEAQVQVQVQWHQQQLQLNDAYLNRSHPLLGVSDDELMAELQRRIKATTK